MNDGLLALKMIQEGEHQVGHVNEEHIGETHYQVVTKKVFEYDCLSFCNIFLLATFDVIPELRGTKVQTAVVLLHPQCEADIHAEPGVAHGRDGMGLESLLTSSLLIFSLSMQRLGA